MGVKKRQLGKTGYYAYPLAFGAVAIGRNKRVKTIDKSPLPPSEEVEKLLHRAVDLGINLFDTAPAYGESQEYIGRFLRKRRGDILLSTKVGEEFNGKESQYNFDPDYIRESLDRSLKKLRTDYVDLFLLHCPPKNDSEVIISEKVIATLLDLKRSGKVRAIGASTTTANGSMDTVNIGQYDVVMLGFNIYYRDEFPAITKARHKNMGVIIKQPLSAGRLTDLVWSLADSEPEYFECAKKLKVIAEEIGESLSGLAFRYLLAHDEISVIANGIANVDHLVNNCEAIERGPLHEEVIAKINAVVSERLPAPLMVA